MYRNYGFCDFQQRSLRFPFFRFQVWHESVSQLKAETNRTLSITI